eukprot:TRINITY_DN6176_c0_g1_i5.p1 TRINITY_DN6176_c0_g1~~TRINITY_DN6176_c0_g1_i5.p1  ORF type:complete len:696 (-),score=119.24 TRINITY_DN6176_c0_g1_i5:211-2298(-)
MDNIQSYKIYSIILIGDKQKILQFINFLYGPAGPQISDLQTQNEINIYTNQILCHEEKSIINIYALPGFDIKQGNDLEDVFIAQQLSDILIKDDNLNNRITFLYLQSIDDKILDVCYSNLKLIYETIKKRLIQATDKKYFKEIKSFNEKYVDTTYHKLMQSTAIIVTFLENFAPQQKQQKIKQFTAYKTQVEKKLTTKYYKKKKKVAKKEIVENPLANESQGNFEFLQIFFPTPSIKETIEMFAKPVQFIPNLIFFPVQMIEISSNIKLITQLLPPLTQYTRNILLPGFDETFEQFIERLPKESDKFESNCIVELPMNWYKKILLTYPDLLPHLKSKYQFKEKNIKLFPSEMSVRQLRTIARQDLLKVKAPQFSLGTIIHCFLSFLTLKQFPMKDFLQERKVLLGSLLHYLAQLTKIQTEISELPQDPNMILQLFNLLQMLPNTLLQNIGHYFNSFLASLVAKQTARLIAPGASASFASVVLLVGQTGYDIYQLFEFRMSPNQLKKNLVVNTSSAGGAIGAGILVGAALGPVGMIVGGLVGGGMGYFGGKKVANKMGKDDKEIQQIFKHEIDKSIYQSLLVAGEIERVEKLGKQVKFNTFDIEQWQKRKTKPEKKSIVKIIVKQKGIQSIVEQILKERKQLKEQWENQIAQEVLKELNDLIVNLENEYEEAKEVLWQFLIYQEHMLSFSEDDKKK